MIRGVILLATVSLSARMAGASCDISSFDALLDSWDGVVGSGSYILNEEGGDSLAATIQSELSFDTGPGKLCIATVFGTFDGFEIAESELIVLETAATPTTLLRSSTVDLPDTLDQILVVVEHVSSGAQRLIFVDEAAVDHRPAPAHARYAADRRSWFVIEGETRRSQGIPSASPEADGTVVRIVPPEEPATGSTVIRVIAAHRDVKRVTLSIDGRVPLEEKRRPYAFRIRLPSPAAESHLEVVAYDSLGSVLGHDRRVVNRFDQPFRVRITGLERDPSAGTARLMAEVDVPPTATLRGIEIFRNDELLHRTIDPRVDLVLDIPNAGLDDFLRVAASLDDGSSIDDVALLSAGFEPEQVEVNLVSFHVVAVDTDGTPIRDLTINDFRILADDGDRSSYRIDDVAFADDVPLRLGTIIDTSGSMQLVMADTKKAAAKFLGTTVRSRDQAFLVDFAEQPRLLHHMSPDVASLLLKLHRLQPQGTTAMYDAIVFSMLQFEASGGRRALVVLTDGDDRDSRFGPKKCVELSRELGVPIYIIALGALDTFERSYRKSDLRKVTRDTGGRLFFVESLAELDQAYATINAELRSQYTVRFYSDRDLSAEQRLATRVTVSRENVSVRAVPAPDFGLVTDPLQ